MARRDKTKKMIRRLCIDGAALCAALSLSYIEALLPMGALIPLPGIKPGLCNIVITALFFVRAPYDAAAVSVCRVLMAGMLFGSPITTLISFCGSFSSFLMLVVLHRIFQKTEVFSFVGISVLSAAAHSAGQVAAVRFILSSIGAWSYLPIMLISSVIFGGLNGVLLNIAYPQIKKICGAAQA